MSNWDKFPVNLCEMIGKIDRKPFVFKYSRFQVWSEGKCIDDQISLGEIKASIKGVDLNVFIDDLKVNKYINREISFKEISTNVDRILWSKDIFNRNGKNAGFMIPDISSLFFLNGKLSKVTYTIHDNSTLIEFYQ